jgi:Domain of unknown function (DUF222)
MTASATTPATTVAAALRADLDAIVALERRIRAAQAEQLRLIERAHGYAHAVEGVHDESSSVEREFGTRSFLAELATALVLPERTAGTLLADAGTARRHPATLAALAGGLVSLPQVRSIFEAVTGLPATAAAQLESAALERAPQQTNATLRRRLRTLRERLHPEPLDIRHRAATLDRRVVLEPAPDGMAWLSLHLQAERAHAITNRLNQLAHTETDSDDPRTRAQRVLDIAADLLLTGLRTDADGHSVDADAAIVARVLVTVPVLTLLGHTDEPAELDGYGPIPADTARRLAAHAPSFHRILTHPETGAYLSYSRTTYRVPADLARYLQARDGTCRFPGCTRRATTCDLDHTTPWNPHGHTSHDNLAHLCRHHHRLKHHTNWQMTQHPNGVIHWTTPTGRHHTTHPEHPFTQPPDVQPLIPRNERGAPADPVRASLVEVA